MYGILVLYIVQFGKTPTPFTAKLDLTQYTERNIKMGDFPAAFDDTNPEAILQSGSRKLLPKVATDSCPPKLRSKARFPKAAPQS